MIRIFIILGFLGSILIFTQCKKSETTSEKQTSISYPVTGKFGANILGMKDSAVINPDVNFSLAANLQSDAILKIIMTNLSLGNKAGWFHDVGTIQNWNISLYNSTSDQQTFSSNTGSLLDLCMTFSDTLGKCKIDYFENNSQIPTKSKFLTWHLTKKRTI